MQGLSRTGSKSSSQSFRWLYPVDHDINHIHEVQLGYQRQIIRLMFALSVLYGISAIQFLPEDCQTSFGFIPASRALSLAGLLTQLAFYHGIPPHIPQAASLLRTDGTRSRAIVFFASLWFPFVPFVLSIIFLCFGTNHGACIPVLWQAPNLDAS